MSGPKLDVNVSKAERIASGRNALGALVRIEFFKIPREASTSMLRMVKARLMVLPSWVHTLRVTYDCDNNADSAAWCQCDPEYHLATIGICAPFLNYDQEARDEVLDHEFGHILAEPLQTFARKARDAAAEDAYDGADQILMHAFETSKESTADELARLIALLRQSRTPNWKKRP